MSNNRDTICIPTLFMAFWMNTWNHFLFRPFRVRTPRSHCNCKVSSKMCSRTPENRQKTLCFSGITSATVSAKFPRSGKRRKMRSFLNSPVAYMSKICEIMDDTDSSSDEASSSPSPSPPMCNPSPWLSLSAGCSSTASLVTDMCCFLRSLTSSVRHSSSCASLRNSSDCKLESWGGKAFASPGLSALMASRASCRKSRRFATVSTLAAFLRCSCSERPRSRARHWAA
mmetsp:Transcript_61795/g.199253  ORF Transcript_61795/g.199253 Transcript_61795/m.199253 type:complete len:228 (-) Transcript_61795:1550-2233(-)